MIYVIIVTKRILRRFVSQTLSASTRVFRSLIADFSFEISKSFLVHTFRIPRYTLSSNCR